jgi:hypothetical protein
MIIKDKGDLALVHEGLVASDASKGSAHDGLSII